MNNLLTNLDEQHHEFFVFSRDQEQMQQLYRDMEQGNMPITIFVPKDGSIKTYKENPHNGSSENRIPNLVIIFKKFHIIKDEFILYGSLESKLRKVKEFKNVTIVPEPQKNRTKIDNKRFVEAGDFDIIKKWVILKANDVFDNLATQRQ